MKAFSLVLLVIVGCGGTKDPEACRQSCAAMGLEAEHEACTTLCNGDCDDLAQTFGMDVPTCERLQRGED